MPPDDDRPAHAPCADCGEPLPPDAPDEGCPRCLMAAALGEEAERIPLPPVPTTPDEVAALFPELEVHGELGRGGMGVVWKARQKSLDRWVALKLLTLTGDDAAAFEERFAREARALARLDHPNIVRVIELGDRDGVFFLTMELVDGVTLREAMRDGGLTPEQALQIVPQMCDALQYAHDQGVVHRDIKPENVLVERSGRVRIADFGLAKLSSGDLPEPTLTRAGQVMGTLHYMAPEQIESPRLVDHRADIYSLGVVFYELLTGELPIGRFDPPSDHAQVDARLDDVVLRALSKRRERRYQSAADVKSEVDSISSSEPPPSPPRSEEPASPSPPPVPSPPGNDARRWCRKAVVGCLLPWGGLALALAVVSVAVLLRSGVDGGANIGAGLLALVALGGGFLVGFVLSVWGWIEIARSDGRLRGLPFAVVGALAPLTLPLVVAMLSAV